MMALIIRYVTIHIRPNFKSLLLTAVNSGLCKHRTILKESKRITIRTIPSLSGFWHAFVHHFRMQKYFLTRYKSHKHMLKCQANTGYVVKWTVKSRSSISNTNSIFFLSVVKKVFHDHLA